MNRNYPKILRNRKRRIERRLQPTNWEDQPRPMLQASNIHYEMAERAGATNCGGIGAMHLLVQRLGLVEDLDRSLHLLKVHLPYHESDHVLNLTYNLVAGGQRLEDIELRRQDEVFLNGLGAQRIPDPTTAGDFTRRFGVDDIVALEGAYPSDAFERPIRRSNGRCVHSSPSAANARIWPMKSGRWRRCCTPSAPTSSTRGS